MAKIEENFNLCYKVEDKQSNYSTPHMIDDLHDEGSSVFQKLKKDDADSAMMTWPDC